MKIKLFFIVITIHLLVACSAENLYTLAQGTRQNTCYKLADNTERNRCLDNANKNYQHYKQEQP